MVTACYEPVVNGVTQMVALYRRHLEAAGHQVTIFTLGEPQPGEDAACVVRSPAIPLGKTGYYVATRYTGQAQDRLREVDVIHCHHLLMGLEFAGRYGRAPVVFTNHTRYDLYLSAYGRFPRRLADLIMRGAWRHLTQMADAVIAPSASTQRILRASGVKTPISLIENGVEIEQFQRPSKRFRREEIGIPEGAIVFAFVGRLSPEKSLRELLQEFAVTAGVVDNAHLLLVGAGPLRGALERQVASAGVKERVQMYGPAAPDDVPALLNASDVFVTASRSEVHPLSVIEALVAGIPVVAYEAPGVGDVVNHEASGLLADGTPGSLAAAMISMAHDRALLHRLGSGARQAGLGYDIQLTVQRTLSLYQRLIRYHADRNFEVVSKRTKPPGSWLTSGHRLESSTLEESLEGEDGGR